jgi:PilZ domain
VAEEKSNPHLFVIERRKEERRILMHVPVEVTKKDGEGHEITERTYIEDVSDFGCRFTARGLVQQGEIIALKIIGPQGNNLPDEEPRLYEIMWVARKERGTTVGARLLQGERRPNTEFAAENRERRREPK